MAQAAIALFAKSIGRCWTLCLGHLPTFTHVGCAPQAATTYMCRIPGCERSYFSEQGVKYHMKHHHTAADLADAPVVRSVSKETSAAQDKASATSTSASVSTPNVTSTASKGATASSERNHRGSYDGETEVRGERTPCVLQCYLCVFHLLFVLDKLFRRFYSSFVLAWLHPSNLTTCADCPTHVGTPSIRYESRPQSILLTCCGVHCRVGGMPSGERSGIALDP
eukprot:m.731339 g.731339  ORF g.731339 m.731339 type:complete len:224 (+) comp23057_c0_seq32:1160-1831(+)